MTDTSTEPAKPIVRPLQPWVVANSTRRTEHRKRQREHRLRKQIAAGTHHAKCGHKIQPNGGCKTCRYPTRDSKPDEPSEAQLVQWILDLDEIRERSHPTEWPEIREEIAELTRKIDAIDRKRHKGAGFGSHGKNKPAPLSD